MEPDTLTIGESQSTSFKYEEIYSESEAEKLTEISELSSPEDGVTESNPCKKRRAPLRKCSIKHRTRESIRLKKCPTVICYDTFKGKSVWSEEDKIMFLKGLEEFGCENIEGLKTYLPHRHENDIMNQIRMWKNFARADLQKRLTTQKKKGAYAAVNAISKLDEWIEHFDELSGTSDMKLFALSNVFLVISEYGKFPPLSECHGVDYRAMYRYIHCMLNGSPYYDVNGMTAKLLNESIAYLLYILREQNLVQSLQPHLFNKRSTKKTKIRTYGRPPRRTTSTNPSAIMNFPNMNPLNIPPHILAKPELSDEDDDSDV